jgi:hypothetical protein
MDKLLNNIKLARRNAQSRRRSIILSSSYAAAVASVFARRTLPSASLTRDAARLDSTRLDRPVPPAADLDVRARLLGLCAAADDDDDDDDDDDGGGEVDDQVYTRKLASVIEALLYNVRAGPMVRAGRSGAAITKERDKIIMAKWG